MQIKSALPPVLSKASLFLEQVSPLSGGLEAYTELHSSWLRCGGICKCVFQCGWVGLGFHLNIKEQVNRVRSGLF